MIFRHSQLSRPLFCSSFNTRCKPPLIIIITEETSLPERAHPTSTFSLEVTPSVCTYTCLES
jgi:hypothetical protein